MKSSIHSIVKSGFPHLECHGKHPDVEDGVDELKGENGSPAVTCFIALVRYQGNMKVEILHNNSKT